MNILIATDTRFPQVNGVVHTLLHVRKELMAKGHRIKVYSGEGLRSLPMPSYPEIRLTFPSRRDIARLFEEFCTDAVHIATEGPVGLAVRKHCLRNDIPFTTGYHTHFPKYVSARVPLPFVEALTYRWLRRFHKPASAVLSPTHAITQELEKNGFTNVHTWTRGVEHALFRPISRLETREERPLRMIFVGRLAVEKGIDDFLEAPVEGEKIVIGDGPERGRLESTFPDAQFTGYLHGEELAAAIGKGDVFVFPSRTDTFGLVMLEAMACGLPVAAYPVPGPIDVVDHGISGWLDEDLGIAIEEAAGLTRESAIAHAAKFTWQETAQQFFKTLVPIQPSNKAHQPT